MWHSEEIAAQAVRELAGVDLVVLLLGSRHIFGPRPGAEPLEAGFAQANIVDRNPLKRGGFLAIR